MPKAKAQDLRMPKPNRTPATKLSEHNNPRGFKGLLPKASEAVLAKNRLPSGQRPTANNWVKASARNSSNRGSDEEETKLP